MREFVYITKALADETRLRILCALRGRELCVCQLVELLELAQSTVSRHMSILHQARLVDSRKEGRWIHFRLAGPGAPIEAREATEWVLRHLQDDRRVRDDNERLASILCIDREELCQRKGGN